MNTLLIYPFQIIEWNNKDEEPRMPLSITYLGAAVRKAGYPVSLLDLRVEQQKRKIRFNLPVSFEGDGAKLLTKMMEDKIVENNVEIVGINCLYSGLFPVVIHLAKQIKSLNPKIKVSIGGIHPTIYTKEILDQYNDIIDYIVIGEGESTFIKLMDCLSSNKLSAIPKLDGLAYHDGNETILNPVKGYIKDLDKIAFPAVDLLNIKDYYTDTKSWHNPKGIPIKTPVPLLSSRSCPKMCNFCSMHLVLGRKIRYRSARNVVDEMKMYVNEFGLNYFNITDDNLTISKKKLMELMNLIQKEKLDIQFSTENGVYLRTMDEEVIDAMSAGGLARLHLAFETGSDYIRNKVIGKGLDNKKIWEIRDILIKEKYNHIFLYGYFVIGFPEETEETLEETYHLITNFPLDNYSLFYAIPFPGTSLYDQCIRDKLFVDENYYDIDLLVNMVSVGQMVKGEPNIKPYNLDLKKLISFKEKTMNHLKAQRTNSTVPLSTPLRMGVGMGKPPLDNSYQKDYLTL